MKARLIGNQGTKWTTRPWPGKNPKGWDGHIIPLDSDEGIQELLDAHPEFHSKAERKLAEWIAGAWGHLAAMQDPLGDVDPDKEPKVLPEFWLAWAREEGK